MVFRGCHIVSQIWRSHCVWHSFTWLGATTPTAARLPLELAPQRSWEPRLPLSHCTHSSHRSHPACRAWRGCRPRALSPGCCPCCCCPQRPCGARHVVSLSDAASARPVALSSSLVWPSASASALAAAPRPLRGWQTALSPPPASRDVQPTVVRVWLSLWVQWEVIGALWTDKWHELSYIFKAHSGCCFENRLWGLSQRKRDKGRGYWVRPGERGWWSRTW